MTSKRHWAILVALLLILSLFLVACERPLPGNNEVLPTATPVETESSSPPDTYPGPAAPEVEEPSTGYPADESSPAGEEDEGGSADLLQPENESETALEGYPGDEDEAADSETTESETTEGETTEDETTEGETTEGETTEGETTEGETTESETTEGETTEGETTEGETTEGETTEGETTEGETTEGETTEGETTEGETTEGETTEGETTEGETTAPAEETGADESGRTHTVAPGETLFRIGMQYGLSWVTLAQANGLTNPNSLYVGQVLTIPDVETTDTTESSESSDAEEVAEDAGKDEAAEEAEVADSDSVEATSEEVTYIVQSGDNLYRISLQFGVNMMEIARANDLANFDQVYAGQELIIPHVETGEETAEGNGEEVTHLVQEGETVFGVAFEYGIAWTKLVEANEIVSPYILEVGQTLVIPSGE